MLYFIALLPFILILSYESFTNPAWQDRRHCQITVGCLLAAAIAMTI
jgi:hypothetical protein